MQTINHTFQYLISICWFVFIIYWVISSIGVKKNVVKSDSAWRSGAWLRIFISAIILLLLNIPYTRGILDHYFDSSLSSSPIINTLGVIICVSGIGFAIWARRHLGRNWSGTPSIKENHELITSGPYRYVRHPIYTGMILAFIGTAIVTGIIWFFVFIIVSISFVMRINIEEGYMMKLFPDQYPEYKKRTKALIPFVW